VPSVPSVMAPALPLTSSLRLGMRFGAHSGRCVPAILVLCLSVLKTYSENCHIIQTWVVPLSVGVVFIE